MKVKSWWPWMKPSKRNRSLSRTSSFTQLSALLMVEVEKTSQRQGHIKASAFCPCKSPFKMTAFEWWSFYHIYIHMNSSGSCMLYTEKKKEIINIHNGAKWAGSGWSSATQTCLKMKTVFLFSRTGQLHTPAGTVALWVVYCCSARQSVVVLKLTCRSLWWIV